jgi:hypothetical protein
MTCGFCQRVRRLPRALIERIVAAQTKAKSSAVSFARDAPPIAPLEVENHHHQPDQRES